MTVLEALVDPADLGILGTDRSRCSICMLSQDLAGGSIGLGPADTPWDSRPKYLGGGHTLTGRDLLHDKPLEPAPGVTLCPAFIHEEHTRFQKDKAGRYFFCDF